MRNYEYLKPIYNPAIDYLEGEVLFKKKLERAKETLKKYGLPKEIMEKFQKEQEKKNQKETLNFQGLFLV